VEVEAQRDPRLAGLAQDLGRSCHRRSLPDVPQDAGPPVQQSVDLTVPAGADPQSVPPVVVVPLAYEDVTVFQLLIDTLQGPPGVPAPYKVRPTDTNRKTQRRQRIRHAPPRGQDAGPGLLQIVLVLDGGGGGGKAEDVAVVRVLDLEQLVYRR